MTEPENRAFVRQARRACVESRELAIKRHVVERLFHRWVRQAKPLLQKMNLQHRRDGEWELKSEVVYGGVEGGVEGGGGFS